MGLFTKRDYKHPDPRVRIEAIEQLEDRQKLVEIACRDDSPRVRMAALARIDDDHDLFSIARDADELDIRLAAVEKITSENLLAELIKIRKNYQLMGACFARITERDVLKAIAEDSEYNPAARRIAVEYFADESYLDDLSETDGESDDEPGSKIDIDSLMEMYGGTRMVRAIGRFRRSEKAVHALGRIARRGGESGELAVEYLCRALGSTNDSVQKAASDELSSLDSAELVNALIQALDDQKLREPIKTLLGKLETQEARDALARFSGSDPE